MKTVKIPNLPKYISEACKNSEFKMVPVAEYTEVLSGSGVKSYGKHFFLAKDNHIILTPFRGFICNQDRRVVEHLLNHCDKSEGFKIIQIPFVAIHNDPEMERIYRNAKAAENA